MKRIREDQKNKQNQQNQQNQHNKRVKPDTPLSESDFGTLNTTIQNVMNLPPLVRPGPPPPRQQQPRRGRRDAVILPDNPNFINNMRNFNQNPSQEPEIRK